jgi:hypothetical protein
MLLLTKSLTTFKDSEWNLFSDKSCHCKTNWFALALAGINSEKIRKIKFFIFVFS